MTNEIDDFMKTFDVIKAELIEDLGQMRLPQNGIDWFTNMIQETVPGGKMNRGLTVSSSLQTILSRPLTVKERQDANILGWCIEMLQAFFLIQDDIMDASQTRRGQPCWLLKKHFKSHQSYGDFIDLFHETTYQTEMGQLMDLITAPEGDVDLTRFSIEKHAYIVEFKTAYYSFYLPIALAMRYSLITDEGAYEQAKSVLLSLGEYFQVQDDFLDCYGRPEVIGKIGTDIEDNKCGWLIVQALARATEEQKKILNENYGRKSKENVALVKEIFKDLDIEGVYHTYEEDSYKRLTLLIQNVDEKLLPQQMFTDFMDRIYKRSI